MPGKNFIKVTSILLLISAVFGIFTYTIAGLLMSFGAASTGEKAGWLLVAMFVMYTIASILQLIAGVKGIKGCAKKEVAGDLKKWGIVVLVIALIAGVLNCMSYAATGQMLTAIFTVAFSAVIPGLYIYGATLNEKA